MGYRSDVAIMAVFENAEHHDEVMAIYRMDPRVQENNCEAHWRRVDRDSGAVVRIFQATDVKWYESYPDVQGFEYLQEVMEMFHENRGGAYAIGMIRIGETDDDTEHEIFSDGDSALVEVLYDCLRLNRSIEIDI